MMATTDGKSRPTIFVYAILLLAAVLAVSGCEERLRPGFPHRAHLVSQQCGGAGQRPCPSCRSCHENLATTDNQVTADVEDCRRCHAEDAEQRLARVRSVERGGTTITFSHSQHLPMKDIRGQCMNCHPGVAQDGVAGRVRPPMAQCLQCHQEQFDRAECTPCHQARDLTVLVPQTFLRHDLGFLRNHGALAMQKQPFCDQCHTQNDCSNCHDDHQRISPVERAPSAIEQALIHRGDFMTRHAIEATMRPSRCESCHSTSFCDSCHVARGVSGNNGNSLNPHPIGWVGPDPMSPNFHGPPARRNAAACASCHEQGPATNCIRCHRVGGFGGNPHPAGWRSARSPNAPMCRYCHVP